jgi:hypothetical protein
MRESRIIILYHQQLGKEFERTEKEGIVKELIHIDEEWKQVKEFLVEAAVKRQGINQNQIKRRWFDEEDNIQKVD